MKVALIFDIPDDIDINKCEVGGDGNIYYLHEGEKRYSIVANIHKSKLKQIDLDAIEDEHPYRIPGDRDSYCQYNEGWEDAVNRIRMEFDL